MNIIFITGSKKRRLNISIGVVGISFVGVCLSAIIAGILYSGYYYASNQSAEILQTIRNSTNSQWQIDLQNQQEELANLKLSSEKSLNAMASRLSIMQGHVMRLDALGTRLSTMAEIDDLEFGVENIPGMGGPGTNDTGDSVNVLDFMHQLKAMELVLDDRQQKLSAIESLLVNRSLQEQIVPEGHPAAAGWMSSLYGYRNDPVTGNKEFHGGLDFAGKPGTPISSIAAGIVIWSGPRYGYGNIVEVSHGGGYMTRYAHNEKNLVNVGEKVEKGEVVAIMGNSGRSTGTHVHFEVLHNGKSVNPGKYVVLK
jgi:murein DD-endopeptidase MepM/ murein hydrolase activator NlpD